MSKKIDRPQIPNQWDVRYDDEDFYYGTDSNDFLREAASRIPVRGKVLCLAEGEGRNAVYLAERGHRVTAVDFSKVGLSKLERLAKQKGVVVEAVHADLNDFKINAEKWDAVVSIWCHTPIELRRKLHSQIVESLNPGGVFILEAYRPAQLEYKTGGPPTADLMMNLTDLKQELTGLKLEIAHEIDREIREGKGHCGKSAVVQVLGFK